MRHPLTLLALATATAALRPADAQTGPPSPSLGARQTTGPRPARLRAPRPPPRAWAELLGRGNAGPLANLPDMFPVEGGVPVLAGGTTVGAVGVSGASGASATQDGQVAQAGASVVTATTTAAATP